MNGQIMALLGVGVLVGAGFVRGSGNVGPTRYQVKQRPGGDYVIVDTVTGDSSADHGETWPARKQAGAVVDRLVAILRQRAAAA